MPVRFVSPLLPLHQPGIVTHPILDTHNKGTRTWNTLSSYLLACLKVSIDGNNTDHPQGARLGHAQLYFKRIGVKNMQAWTVDSAYKLSNKGSGWKAAQRICTCNVNSIVNQSVHKPSIWHHLNNEPPVQSAHAFHLRLLEF